MPKVYGRSWLDNDAIAALIFLPALILLSIFLLGPIAYLFYLSFTAGSFTSDGISWVLKLLALTTNPDFGRFGQHRLFHPCNRYSQSSSSLGLAVLLNRAEALQGLLRSAYFLPSIISLVAAVGFRWLFQTEGPVNALLSSIGISPDWLGSTTWAMPVLILLSIWKQLGFNMVVFWLDCKPLPVVMRQLS